MVEIVFIAISLSMDALAVIVAYGIGNKKLTINKISLMASFFGLFQAIMPIIGWLTGQQLKELITGVDHWIAFFLLCFVGFKMVFSHQKGERDNLNLKKLLILSTATSIDALVIGISFSLLNIKIFIPAIIIGTTTFFISFFGGLGGVKFKNIFLKKFKDKINILGGVVLIIIGVKILFEHVL